MMLFATTWSADIGAFAVGSVLKGPKLWPRFSPNKTWSGFVGGLVSAMLAGSLMAALPYFNLNIYAAAAFGLAVGLATMAGDLWESALKRRFGVKDSGDLIPGHGGLLDRVDGLMFAVVVMAALRLANQLGSIGVSTLDLLEQAGVDVEIIGLTAGRNVARLADQALRWRPQIVAIADESRLPELRERLKGSGIQTAAGSQAVEDIAAADAQWVMSAIVGFAGLAPTLAAARTGAIIALANKESLVCAGPSLLRTARRAGGVVIPVDSEHSAIFQVLDPAAAQHVKRPR
eukprot:gene24098-31309_t